MRDYVRLDPTGKYLAFVGSDGAVQVHNASNGERHSSFHTLYGKGKRAKHSVSALCWVCSEEDAALLAVGTSSGHTVLHTVATGKQVWTAASMHPGPVQGIAPVGESLVVASRAGGLTRVALSSGVSQATAQVPAQSPLTCCATCPLADSGMAVVGGATFLLVTAKDLQPCLVLAGHKSAASAAAVTPDGLYVVTGAVSDATLAIFSLAVKTSTKSRTRKPRGHIQLEHAPTMLACAAADGSPSVFLLLAITEAATVEVWECNVGASDVHAKRRCRASVAGCDDRGVSTQGSTKGGIFAACFDGPHSVRLAYGLQEKASVESVEITAAAPSLVTLRPAASPLVQAPQGQEGHTPIAENEQQLGRDNSGLTIARTRLHLDGDAAEQATAKVPDTEFEDSSAAIIPLGERLAAMASVAGHDSDNVSGDAAASKAAATSVDFQDGAVTAASLTILLAQALTAQDWVLFDRVLSCGSQAVISKTMQQLPAPAAAALLHASVARLQRRPARSQMLLPWLRATLLHHSTFLAAVPAAQEQLATVQRLVEARAETLQPLLAMRGRLDLVLAHSQRPSNTTIEGASEALVHVDAAALKPKSLGAILNAEASDSDFEVEDPYAAPQEDAGWETDDSAVPAPPSSHEASGSSDDGSDMDED